VLSRLRHSQRGQASVELLGALPLVLLAGLAAWQLVLAGHTLWLSAHAARAAARADAVGEDPSRAARSALPSSLERGLRVTRRPGGGITVRVRVPLVARHLGGRVAATASSSFGGSR
jgi:hypothetical protein